MERHPPLVKRVPEQEVSPGKPCGSLTGKDDINSREAVPESALEERQRGRRLASLAPAFGLALVFACFFFPVILAARTARLNEWGEFAAYVLVIALMVVGTYTFEQREFERHERELRERFRK